MISMTSLRDFFSSWYSLVIRGLLVSHTSIGTRLRIFDCKAWFSELSPSETEEGTFPLAEKSVAFIAVVERGSQLAVGTVVIQHTLSHSIKVGLDV